ncbi:hypothetical protein chiPu_0023386 [Chiloscyllium punctatum]|uniref:Uncharacterized protein n=1 Tax=Chiloscyllium punctatum TaxID=137246 RepID=A0A401TAB9_CHIPU|nr:hypothetical protein [Chiloscyllium punctatum]
MATPWKLRPTCFLDAGPAIKPTYSATQQELDRTLKLPLASSVLRLGGPSHPGMPACTPGGLGPPSGRTQPSRHARVHAWRARSSGWEDSAIPAGREFLLNGEASGKGRDERCGPVAPEREETTRGE